VVRDSRRREGDHYFRTKFQFVLTPVARQVLEFITNVHDIFSLLTRGTPFKSVCAPPTRKNSRQCVVRWFLMEGVREERNLNDVNFHHRSPLSFHKNSVTAFLHGPCIPKSLPRLPPPPTFTICSASLSLSPATSLLERLSCRPFIEAPSSPTARGGEERRDCIRERRRGRTELWRTSMEI